MFKFYYIKIPETQKAPLFAVFALRAICKKRGAKKGQKAPLLRKIARSGHTALEEKKPDRWYRPTLGRWREQKQLGEERDAIFRLFRRNGWDKIEYTSASAMKSAETVSNSKIY